LAGLLALTEGTLARDWIREDGAPLRIGLCMVDANWETETVLRFCRDSSHAAVIRPARGKYVGARSKALNDRDRRPGDLVGLHWRIPSARAKRDIRQVEFDTNFWKSFLQARLATGRGDRSSLEFYAGSTEHHRMLAEHVEAEYPITLTHTASGREVQEWKPRPNRDNHWLDCLVGCCVGGSILGAELMSAAVPTRSKPRKKWSEMRRERMGQIG